MKKGTGEDQGSSPGTDLQTQLQLMCDNVTCAVTNFTACDTYGDLGIPQGIATMVVQ